MTDGYKIKRILTWVENTTKGLPAEYQEVEYIQSSGTQRIDTGVNPTDTKFGIKGKFRIGANGGDVLIDLSDTTSTDNKRYGFQFNGLKPQWSGIMYQQRGEDNGTISSSSDYEFSYNYNGDASFTINGNTKTGIPTGSATLPNRNIFCQNCNGSYKRFFTGRLYWLQLYHNTELLRDFVPCYRKSDNVIGLYDLVNDQFYTNSGSGTFTKGNDIPDMVEKQIYPVGWKPGSNTVAYYPLKSDVKDYSGNNNDGTLTGSGTYENNGLTLTPGNYISIPNPGISSGSITISVWMKINNYSKVNSKHYFKSFGEYYENSGSAGCFVVGYDVGDASSSSNVRYTSTFCYGSSQQDINTGQSSDYYQTWHHLLLTYNGTTYYFYVDGSLVGSMNHGLNWSSISSYNWYINNANNMRGGYCSFGNAIIENKSWTAEEVSDYYNHTKGNYGL